MVLEYGSRTLQVGAGMSANHSRRSVEMREAVVQGTLISHLHSRMLPRMLYALFVARCFYFLGLGLVMWGIYEEGVDILDILLQQNLIGAVLTTVVDCIVNKKMITICFLDMILAGLVKLRLFDGRAIPLRR